SCQILLHDLKSLRTAIAKQPRRLNMTPMLGGSPGVHAEPVTVGLKLPLIFEEFGRAEERLTQTRERTGVGQLSGPGGTEAHVALWHERDISHSSAERIILPDSCILLDYMLVKLRDTVEKLQIYPERMAQNLAVTKGLYFSQSILLALTRAGAERKIAYEAVQRAAMRTWKGEGTFAEN